MLVGHRAAEGPKSGTNENTLLALETDYKLGVGCETDSWRLAANDGTPNKGISVIFHDQTLGRVVSASSLRQAGLTAQTKIGDVTYQQFSLLRTKGGQPLPTLQQWIQRTGELKVSCMIEIKFTPGNLSEVAGWVRDYSAPVSFYARPQDPNSQYPCYQTSASAMIKVGLKVGLKYNTKCPMTIDEISAFGYSYVTISPSKITKTFVKKAHAAGLKVGNYNSKSKKTWKKLVEAGSDFIIAGNVSTLNKWAQG